MYRVLITDDEKIVRDSIGYILEKNFSNIEFQTAKSGREAIEKGEIFKPDIIFMDIKMPGINGIEAMREIKRKSPDSLFIIVSAYEQFEFAKEAVSLGVLEYILKPMNKSTLINIMEKALNIIEIKREKRKKEIEYIDKIERTIPQVEHNIIYSIMLGLDNININDANEALVRLNKYGYISVVEIDENDCELYGKIIYDLIIDTLKSKYNSIIGPLMNNKVIYLIEGDNLEELTGKEVGNSILQKLMDYNNKLVVKIGIGTVQENKLLNLSYNQAIKALFLAGKLEVKHVDEIKENNLEISGYIDEMNTEMSKISKRHINKLVVQAKKYIDSNYNNEFSLEDIAREVAVTPTYFSKLFKDATGENYIEYLTRVRMEKAKELMLNSNISIKEISYIVGYNDPNYFSRLFKKIEKVSPTEYLKDISIK